MSFIDAKLPNLRIVLCTCLITCLPILTGCTSSARDGQLFRLHKRTLHPAAETATRRPCTEISPNVPRELTKMVTPPYTVAPGDVLLVQPADIHSPVLFPPDQMVLLDGTIHLGKYGQLNVAGKTLVELEALVRAQCNGCHGSDVGAIIVRVVVPESKVYYVLGEVLAPGAFPLKGRETVLDGLLAAGGLNPRAAQSAIILSRPTAPRACRKVLPVQYDEIVQLGDTTTNYQLQPGDRIYVPGRSCWDDFFGGLFCRRQETRPQTICPTSNCGPPASLTLCVEP